MFLAIFSIVYGVVSLPFVLLLATNKIKWESKRDKKLYKTEGRKIANRWNAVFMTLMSLTVIVFGVMLLMERYEILTYIIPLLAIEALGLVGVLIYVNMKWRK